MQATIRATIAGAVMTPIYQTSTFAFQGVNRPGPFEYSRSGNPTRKALETCLAAAGRRRFRLRLRHRTWRPKPPFS